MKKKLKDKILDKLNSPAIGYENEEIAKEILELFKEYAEDIEIEHQKEIRDAINEERERIIEMIEKEIKEVNLYEGEIMYGTKDFVVGWNDCKNETIELLKGELNQ